MLGRVVEVVSGKSLYQFEKERLLDPLGMSDTAFFVRRSTKRERIANPCPTIASGTSQASAIPIRTTALGIRRRRHGSAPSAIMRALREMLLEGGALDGRRYLKPETVAR